MTIIAPKKICRNCKNEYIDFTKRKVGKTCSKACASFLMVSVRKINGSFKRSDEQNRKMVETMDLLRKEGKWQISSKAKKRLSDNLTPAWHFGTMKQQTQATCMNKYGVSHHMKTEFHKKETPCFIRGKK